MRIELSPQVLGFVRSLAPEPRKTVRRALHALERGRGDLIELEEPLAGYHRLRIGRYRVILRWTDSGGETVAQCVFAERRALVYELFGELLDKRQAERGE